MRNIFLKKSYTKYAGETIPRLFSKKSKLSVSLCFIVCQAEGYRNILKRNCSSLAFTLCKAFFKKKKSETGLPVLFSA